MTIDICEMFNGLSEDYNGGASSYRLAYRYWKAYLLNSINNIASWELKGNTKRENMVLSKQIENRLLLLGCCGLVLNKNKKLIAVQSMLNGITDYADEFTRFTYATPLNHSVMSGVEIGKDGVLVDNDNLRMGYMHLIHRYAMMLGHTEITLINSLINMRVGRVYVASTDKVAQSIRDFRSKIYRGKNDVIVDKSFLGVEVHDDVSGNCANLNDLLTTRDTLLTNFYQDIGINRPQQKKERMVVDEVNADNQLLQFNLDDMKTCREVACEEVKSVFGLDLSVKFNIKNPDELADANFESEVDNGKI